MLWRDGIYSDPENQDEYAIKWRGLIEESVIFGSVFHDYDYLDLKKLEVQRNAVLLQELVDRSKKGVSLIDGIGEYLQVVTVALDKSPIPIHS